MLVVDEVSRAEEIKLDDEKFNQAFSQTFMEMQGSPQMKKIKKPSKELANSIAYEAAARTLNRQVLEHLKKIASGASDVSEKPKKASKKTDSAVESTEGGAPEKPAKKAPARAKKAETAVSEKPAAKAAPRVKKSKEAGKKTAE
jgi:hypothetical protein